MATTPSEVRTLDPRETMALFSQAWSRGDVDGLTSLMAESATYRSSEGAEYAGRPAIREAFAAICRAPTGVVSDDTPPARMMFFDLYCLSFWSLDLGDGTVQGIDVISFDSHGLITCKDAYRKVAGSV